MKFTSFNPLIVTKDAAPVIELMETLGFDRRHHNKNIDERNISNVSMRDDNGYNVDVAQANVSKDMLIIRMNVDDFDEAYEFLTARGFTNPSGHIVISKSSKSVLMVSPSGFAFDLCHHIKDND